MFSWFEKLIDPFKPSDYQQPPTQLHKFYWHYLHQVWQYFGWILVIGLFAALTEIALFVYIGQLVDMMRQSKNPQSFFTDNWIVLIWMTFVVLIARPVLHALHVLVTHQAIIPQVTTMIRWQTHKYILRQSLSFFQNDFAGRIANRIMQTGPAARETAVQFVDAIWFVLLYTVGALVLFFHNDPRLMIPLVLWIIAYGFLIYYYVPKIKDLSLHNSEARSSLMGRVVDSYTNILTVKLFASADREDEYVRETMEKQTATFTILLRAISRLEIWIMIINGLLIVGTAGLAIWLWSGNAVTIGAIALAIGLVIRINNMSQWIMWVFTGIFENIGMVQEGMETISKPLTVVDDSKSCEIKVDRGGIIFDDIRFHYGQESGVIDNLALNIRPGEKVGLIGPSGAGKSTLVNLLLRFHDLDGGRILLDGQDISKVTQDSLRSNIAMVTQDTSLLHRSVSDNISYGAPDAKMDEIIAAAQKAHAHDFILGLEDKKERKGYAAHVGERGVKLSGGQRQRVAIARVILKDAPILILDEATSALDSEVEAAIQEQLSTLMEGKTVIAIAHRLSTIAAMDRLVIMDNGDIIEDGTHEELLKRGGLYARLWSRQSGGFLLDENAA